MDSKILNKNGIPFQKGYVGQTGFVTPPYNATNENSYISSPYEKHAWVYASARNIAINISQVPRVVVNTATPNDFILEHPILESFNNPNPLMPSSTVLMQSIVLSLLLSPTPNSTGGQVFLIPLKFNGKKVNLKKGEIPELWYPFNDQYITPAKDPKKGFVGWQYKPPENTGIPKQTFSNDELIRIHFYNPNDWTKGLSFLNPATLAILQDVKASIYNTTFFDNDATVAGVLSSDEDLQEEQAKTYLKMWYENYGGPGKANRVAALGMGLKYQQMGQSQADMQFTQQKEYNKEEILACFGLNKIAVGDYEDINFATIREGRRMLWQDTYRPILKQIIDAFNDQFVRFLDGNIRISSDFSNIEALEKDYSKPASAAKTMIEAFELPPVEAARINGIPITEAMCEQYPWLKERPAKKQSAVVEPEKTVGASVINKRYKTDDPESLTEDERIALSWDYINTVLLPGEKSFLPKLIRFFNSQRNRMQDNVDKWARSQEKNIKDNPGLEGVIKQISIDPFQFMLSIVAENERFYKIMSSLVKEQMKREESRLDAELDGLIEFGVTDPMVSGYVKDRTKIYDKINTTTFNVSKVQIKAAIEEAVNINATVQQTAKLLKEHIGNGFEVRKNQAQTIARTEMGSVSSITRYKAFIREGIEYGEWLNAADARVRTDHKNAPEGVGGMVVKLGDKFPRVNMRFPNDPTGAPEQVINCRCVLIASRKPRN